MFPADAPAPSRDLSALAALLDRTALDEAFSGVISIDVDGVPVMQRGYGLAERALRVPNTPQTRFGVASASKVFTALAVLSLVEDHTLSLTSRIRPMLHEDLPEIDDDVTVEHLLGHTSGIGDYLDEEADWDVADYVLPVPVHTLAETEGFLPVLGGRPQVSAPGKRFAYNNGGYVVLALAAERASGVRFHDLVAERVLTPARLTSTGYPRLDEPTGAVAIGYVDRESVRSNVLHLPVRGNGDGGAVTTVSDLSRFWRAFADGKIVRPETVAAMIAPRHHVADEGMNYGLGLWLDEDGPGWVLEGYDPGVSVRTRFDPTTRATVSIVSNDSEGAWPVIGRYADWLAGA